MEREFPGIIVRDRNEEEGTTGTFDIFVGSQRVHSKLNGDGWLDTPQKMKKLHSAVRASTIAGKGGAIDLEVATLVESENDKEEDEEEEEEDEGNASLIVSLLTLVLSIPALIGA